VISILIVSYNAVGYNAVGNDALGPDVFSYGANDVLGRCLSSVEGLASDGHEVWVVDNASQDGTVDRLRKDFPFCRVIALEDNLGFGAANNRGAHEAAGEALLLLNPDAWLEEGCFERLQEALDRDSRVGLVAPTIRYPDGRPQFNWSPTSGLIGEALQKVRNAFESRAVAHRPCARLLRALGNQGWFSSSCCLIRRRAFEEIGGFDESFFLYFEDVDLCDRLASAGWKMHDEPDAVAFHQKGAVTLSQTDKVPYRRAQFLYYAKHRPTWENRLLLRRQRRRFEREPDAEYRRRLLEVWEEASRGLEKTG
jgi:GT2 family glycosyltransferase